jgi:NADPH:quinone reductase
VKAIVFDRFGGPGVLTHAAVPRPTPGATEVLIRARYAGVNFADVARRRGQIPGTALPYAPGLEVAGEVAGVGARVTTVGVGDPVVAYCGAGGYAEYAVATETQAFRLPSGDDLTLLRAVAFPTSIVTAWMVLAFVAGLRHGETLLVHAAAGALGTALAQVARRLGANRVIGTTSTPDKAVYACDHGYERTYERSGWLDSLRHDGLHGEIDVAIESVGGRVLIDTIDVLAPGGRVVVVGNSGGNQQPAIDVDDMWQHCRSLAGFAVAAFARSRPVIYRREALRALEIHSSAGLTVPVDCVGTLGSVADVHARLESGATTGKLAVRVGR